MVTSPSVPTANVAAASERSFRADVANCIQVNVALALNKFIDAALVAKCQGGVDASFVQRSCASELC